MRNKLIFAFVGYVVAFLVAMGSVWVNRLSISAADSLASGGMYAFGEVLLFCFSLGVFSIPPTILVIIAIATRRNR